MKEQVTASNGTGADMVASSEFRSFADHCHNLSYSTQSPEFAAKLQDFADECKQRANELAAPWGAISGSGGT